MIVILKKNPDKNQMDSLTNWFRSLGVEPHVSVGSHQTIIGLVGDTSRVDMDVIRAMDIVEDVRRIQEPFKNANRKFHPEDTVIDVGGVKIGGGHFAVMAGPCSVESEEQICACGPGGQRPPGAQVLRGGAFKPRTSPYAFQGLHGDGHRAAAARPRSRPACPSSARSWSIPHLPLFEDVDIIQVGARNMQNFELLKELGQLRKPVLLKRGLANTIAGAADERRIHHGRRQRAGDPLRAGHPHL